MQQTVEITYLDYRPSAKPAAMRHPRPYALRASRTPCPVLNRFLYVSIGYCWCWHERLPWSLKRWRTYLEDSAVATWVAYKSANPIGYFELRRDAAGAVEIAYFGLMPDQIGKGLGKLLLRDAIHKATAFGNGTVWLHTCSLDHPAALPNYLSLGFKVRKTLKKTENLPDAPIEPWPGAFQDAGLRR